MRRTFVCGLLAMLVAVAAWGAKVAVAQVAEKPRSGDAGVGQEIVVETVDPNGVGHETRVFAAPGANPSAIPARGGQYAPVQIRLFHESDELQPLKRQEAELAQQSQSLVKKLAETEGDAERTGLVNELEEAINKQFDVQQQIRELEVSRIETKVKKLRETITKRAGARAAIVRNRREQLLQEAEGLGWNSPEPGPAGGFGAFYQPAHEVRPLPAVRAP